MVTVADAAFSIAVVRAEEANRPEGEQLFADPYARLFVAAGAHAAEATQRSSTCGVVDEAGPKADALAEVANGDDAPADSARRLRTPSTARTRDREVG